MVASIAWVPVGPTVMDIVESTRPYTAVETAGADPSTLVVPPDGAGTASDEMASSTLARSRALC